MPAKTSDGLVEQKNCSSLFAEILEPGQKAGRRRNRGLRFKNDAGDLIGVPIKKLPQAVEIVVPELEGHVGDCLRNSGGQFGCTDEPVVDRKERMVATDGD